MGGSGGGGGIGIGPNLGSGGGGTPGSSCETLVFTTRFVAVNEADLDGVNEGDTVSLVIAREDPNSVIFITANGKKLSEVETSQKIKLIECLRGGHTYAGVLTEIDGDCCKVSVSHSGKA